MKRRALLGVAATALASGCFGYGRYLSAPGGSVEFWNETEEPVSVHVRLDNDAGGVALDDTYEVAPESDREVEDAFGGGSYDATVSVNGGELTASDDLNVGSCSAIRFLVRIDADGLDLSQGYCD
ncbi:hypothetical protein [Halobacterium jilantaiense]|uniref:Ig-like domain-containing protein n=1 Tax=Halobacterium jilantaiense TaxID=355548 RepID=A0A1I0QTR2_9EURY|nr:hypothetical protein [Halobacterium jilantaiense]SEW30790.1 hypothetical protein SAMN04487945_2960 [Halobacterium jilantaiense]